MYGIVRDFEAGARQLPRRNDGVIGPWGPGTAEGGAAAPLLQVLWRRRGTLLLTMLGCVLLAGAYLAVAKRVFVASAAVMVREHAPRVMGDDRGIATQSDTYLQTQSDVFRSTPVLARALDAVGYRSMKTFAGAGGDPVAWLRGGGGGFKVEAGRKSDVVTVSMESSEGEEAAAVVNAVVEAYAAEAAAQQRRVGGEMVAVLREEREALGRELALNDAAKLDVKRKNGVASFRDDRSNASVERMSSLSGSLTAAEIATIELRAQERFGREMLLDPGAMSAFVSGQQAKGRDAGDYEYEELRRQLVQTALALASNVPVVGMNHPRLQVLEAAMESLRKRIAQKERAIAEAHVAAVATLRGVAEEKERALRAAVGAEEDRAIRLTPAAAEYARLEAEAERIRKRCEQIEARIAEVNVNDVRGRPMNVRVLEPARVGEVPVKPKKAMVLGAGLLAGWVLGLGLALVGEWHEARLRSPREIVNVLGMPVVATVPRISKRLSPVTRGQLVRLDVRSPVAEAYHSVRTALHLMGAAHKAKTILLASPMEGDGKSTSASNLAIAFAQAGERTLIVDCDLREPVQHLIFEAEGRIGLTNVITGEVKLRDAVCPTRVPNLYLLPCGPVPLNPSELLTGRRFDRLMRALSASFDRIIIDSPPLMVFTDGRVLAAGADATLLVLRMNQSVRELGLSALDGLGRVGANVLGAIANDVAPERAYRKYGGTWQYAARSADRAGRVGEGPLALPSAASEVPGIEEPDWSSDVPPGAHGGR
jgi:succinoglycan biosynthesis transport protein ExoP